ncbi:MAG: DNA adenine methylase [Candidatus Binatia bacterium]
MRTNPFTTGIHTTTSNKPLIRWAGGKRLIVSKLLAFLPKNFGTYYEPMIGSGALFFARWPKQAVLADVNPEIVNFYKVIKKDPRGFYDTIRKLKASKYTYYEMRASAPSSPVDKAVRFFYLIRLSWNGLYRVNQEGNFNVPFGGRTPQELITLERILRASHALKNARLLCGDFEETTATAKAGDLAYFDPPYPRGACNGNGFARYSSLAFSVHDHTRLANHVASLADRGVHVVVTHAARKDIRKLFPACFFVKFVKGFSLIAASSRHRKQVYEVILTSYRS